MWGLIMKKIKPAKILQREIEELTLGWSYQQKTIVKLIFQYPAIRTHEIAQQGWINNVPHVSCKVNEKLKTHGLELTCVRPQSNKGSFYWFLVEREV